MKKALALICSVLFLLVAGCSAKDVDPNPSGSSSQDVSSINHTPIEITQRMIDEITAAEKIKKVSFSYYDGTEICVYDIEDTEGIQKIREALADLRLEKTDPFKKYELQLQPGLMDFHFEMEESTYSFFGLEGDVTRIQGKCADRTGDTYIVKNYNEFKSVIYREIE